MGHEHGEPILVRIGTNKANKGLTTSIVEKYRDQQKITMQTRVRRIILSGLLLVFMMQ